MCTCVYMYIQRIQRLSSLKYRFCGRQTRTQIVKNNALKLRSHRDFNKVVDISSVTVLKYFSVILYQIFTFHNYYFYHLFSRNSQNRVIKRGIDASLSLYIYISLFFKFCMVDIGIDRQIDDTCSTNVPRSVI